jgi:PHP family Zn ribbon phosphoesterase/transcriptional regulator with XRE-family HTH domain
MDLENLDKWAKIKGIKILGVGDFTHPEWLKSLKEKLEPAESGLFKLKNSDSETRFILTTEVNCIYSKRGRVRKIHIIIFAPSFEIVDKINAHLGWIGNLKADGRPILGLDAKELAKIVLNISGENLIVPAHCLLPDTYLHCNPGIKKIKDISIGDKVYTHKERLKKVKQIYTRFYKGPIYHIKLYYFRIGLQTTPEHPFYVIKTYKNCSNFGIKKHVYCRPACAYKKKRGCPHPYFENYYPQWVQAKDIEKGDVIIFPRFNKKVKNIEEIKLSNYLSKKYFKVFQNKIVCIQGRIDKKLNNTIKIDKNFCRLVGYYISEGYTDNRDSISFCFNRDERKYVRDLKSLMEEVFELSSPRIYRRKNADSIEVIYFSKILAKAFSKLFYNHPNIKKAPTKCLPHWMLNLPLEKQVEILKGWWRGDTGITSSRELMNQMKIICLRLGIIPSIYQQSKEEFNKEHIRKWKIENRAIKAQCDSFSFHNLSFFENPFGLLKTPEFRKFNTKLNRRHGWMDEKYVYLPVRNIEIKNYKGEVYNLEVEKDNSYLTEFATTHNCLTPWFGIFGSKSGFDSIEECFEEYSKYIYAGETGLSASPEMLWRMPDGRRITLISNSDSHCVHPDTNIYTIYGKPKPIKDLNPSKALSIDFTGSLKQVEAKISRLHKLLSPPILYKTTTRTKEIITTPEHRFFVFDNEKIIEKKASELKKDDLVACLRQIYNKGKSQKLSHFDIEHELKIYPAGIDYLRKLRIKNKKTQKDVGRHIGVSEDCVWIFEKHKVETPKESFVDKFCEYVGVDKDKFKKKFMIERFPSEEFPEFTDEKFCQILGYTLGDGGIEHSEGEIDTFSLTDKDLNLLSYYQHLIKQVFNIEGRLRKKRGNSYSIRYPSYLAKYFQKIDSKLLISGPKRQIPEFVFGLPKKEIAAFLRGLYDAEGTSGHHFVQLSSSSLTLIKEAQTLLLKFGLSSYAYPNFEKNKKKWRYQLHIYGQEQLEGFNEEIGFNSISKKIKLTKYLSSLFKNPKNSFVDPLPLKQEILKIKQILKPSTYDIPRRLYYHLAHQNTLKRNNVQEFLKIFSKYTSKKTISALEKLKKFGESDIIWEPVQGIRRIKSNCKFVYDLTIPSYENYVANGFITHNSPSHIGREANVFDTEISYPAIIEAIKTKDPQKFLYTIEFFPQEGKYHYDGHRMCGISLSPAESKKYNNICPNCGRPLTIGVLNRVDSLADRPEGFKPENAIPFKSLVPLAEIIADALGVMSGTKQVEEEYKNLIEKFGNEFNILIDIPRQDLEVVTLPEIAEGIIRVREGKVFIEPGYDGVYGKIRIFSKGEQKTISRQKTLF